MATQMTRCPGCGRIHADRSSAFCHGCRAAAEREFQDQTQMPARPAAKHYHAGWLIVILAPLFGMAIWLTSSGWKPPPLVRAGTARAVEDRPGNPDVYRRIETSTDCAELLKLRNTALDNLDREEATGPEREHRQYYIAMTRKYAVAAQERMDELGCPGD